MAVTQISANPASAHSHFGPRTFDYGLLRCHPLSRHPSSQYPLLPPPARDKDIEPLPDINRQILLALSNLASSVVVENRSHK
jgi:hypothetical protein